MHEESVSGTVVALQRGQPLTTDLSGLGEVVVLTDGPPDRVVRSDAPSPRRVLSRSRSEWAGVVRALAADGPLQVVTNDEFALDDCAQLRDVLGLGRVTPSGLEGYLDKAVMKQRLEGGGLRVPRWATVSPDVESASSLVPPERLRLPVVAKPRIGSNSRGVRVLRDVAGWASWVADRSGESGWQVEEFVDGGMCFVDAMVVDGEYEPVLVGRYLGGLLPDPDVNVLGAVSVDRGDPLWQRAAALGRAVAEVLGCDGRFATHLEFFDCGEDLVVMEVSARAPGAMVSEMARVTAGANLETCHLRVQAGLACPTFAPTGVHAAWISVLARGDQTFIGAPALSSRLRIHRMPPPPEATERYVACLALLTSPDVSTLDADVRACIHHPWHR